MMLHPATLRLIATRNQAGNPAKLLDDKAHFARLLGGLSQAGPQLSFLWASKSESSSNRQFWSAQSSLCTLG
jgi:hypothetical protein